MTHESLNIPTPASTCAQRQSQLISAAEVLFGIRAGRMIAKIIIMNVRDKMLMSASFFLNDIWTFHSLKTGIVSTVEWLRFSL